MSIQLALKKSLGLPVQVRQDVPHLVEQGAVLHRVALQHPTQTAQVGVQGAHGGGFTGA